MNERDALFLAHVLSAIADIESFTVEGREVFMLDRKTQSAVIRRLGIIGEAVKKPSTALTQREPVVSWRQIASTRDRLIHAYFNVDLDAVWSMVDGRSRFASASPQRRPRPRILAEAVIRALAPAF